jgi:hypothetical protein
MPGQVKHKQDNKAQEGVAGVAPDLAQVLRCKESHSPAAHGIN